MGLLLGCFVCLVVVENEGPEWCKWCDWLRWVECEVGICSLAEEEEEGDSDEEDDEEEDKEEEDEDEEDEEEEEVVEEEEVDCGGWFGEEGITTFSFELVEKGWKSVDFGEDADELEEEEEEDEEAEVEEEEEEAEEDGGGGGLVGGEEGGSWELGRGNLYSPSKIRDKGRTWLE